MQHQFERAMPLAEQRDERLGGCHRRRRGEVSASSGTPMPSPMTEPRTTPGQGENPVNSQNKMLMTMHNIATAAVAASVSSNSGSSRTARTHPATMRPQGQQC